MNTKLFWTAAALERIYELHHLFAQYPGISGKVFRQIRSYLRVLKEYPRAGRPAPDIEAEQRELLIPFGDNGFVILYQEEAFSTLLILALRRQKDAGYVLPG
jgi:plasmid stabilization system protein ParE